MSLDVYTPWRESAEALMARHVGRKELIEGLRASGRAHLAGDKPLHWYLFGPRGSGKSHLLALERADLTALAEQAGRKLLTLSEDIPLLASAEEIEQRLLFEQERPTWGTWGRQEPVDRSVLDGAIVFFEGLDRQLHNLASVEQKRLRSLIQDRSLWVVGTGVALGDVFTKQTGAFYNFFSPWPLEALSDDESAALLDHLVTEEVRAMETWPARRTALVGLAGGSPRTLVALGGSCAENPEAWASDHLHAVVRQFTAHYQLRFRDLNPTGQRVVEQITRAPGALSPKEVGEAIGADQKSVGVAMRRLLDEGVLRVRHEGRRAMYTVTEPLFRFWYEYRTAPWEQTRVGWLARLIEEVMTPEEMSRAWLDNPDPMLAEPLRAALHGNQDAILHAAHELLERAKGLASPDSKLESQNLVKKGQDLLLDSPGALMGMVLSWAVESRSTSDYRALSWVTELCDSQRAPPQLATLLGFAHALAHGTMAPKRALEMLLRTEVSSQYPPIFDALLTHELVTLGLRALRKRSPWGRPWSVTDHQRRRIASTPGLRAIFLVQGRFRSHPPLIEPDDVLAIGGPYVDASYLAEAAHELQHPVLFADALADLSVAPFCSFPARRAPAAHETVARLSEVSLGDDFPVGWTWAASWADASPEAFARIVAAAAVAGPIRLVSGHAKAALTMLGVRSPERLQGLLDAVEDPDNQELLATVRDLAAQVRARDRIDLHTELQSFLALGDVD